MASFKIEWMERKTNSTGKNMIKASLGADGKVITDVAIWESNWPEFATLQPGMMISGDISTKVNGQYTNNTLYPVKTYTTFGGKAAPMKMMEKKAEYIKEAQDRKEDSIAFFNATNAAIELTKTFGEMSSDDRKESIIFWREWFLSEYENYKSKPF